jgi:hypothetical protein
MSFEKKEYLLPNYFLSLKSYKIGRTGRSKSHFLKASSYIFAKFTNKFVSEIKINSIELLLILMSFHMSL